MVHMERISSSSQMFKDVMKMKRVSESFSTHNPLKKYPDRKDESMHSSGISCLLSRGSEGVKDGGEAVGILDYLPGNYCHRARAAGTGSGIVDGRRGSMRGLGTRRPLTFSPT